jgi:ABC-type sugar transport system substrate-binding protein
MTKLQHIGSNGRRRKALSLSLVAAFAACALILSGCGSSGSSGSSSSSASSMKGKKILIVPYWLDNFNTGYTSWITRDLKKEGATTTVINANAVASRQLDAINNAINTKQYDGIVWAPIDLDAAANTVKQIQAAGIPQVVFEADLDPSQVKVPQVNLDEKNSLTAAGKLAATYIKDHPKLGSQPLAAFMGVYPQNSTCVTRKDSFLKGMQSVTPDAKVVYFGAAQNAADATTKMSDFITTHTKFNITIGCGSASTLGALAAMKSAGLANAVNKVPTKVFAMTQDGTPAELDSLWNKDSALMVSMLLPPKTGAQQTVNLLSKLVTGKLPLDSTESVQFGWTPITPDCAKYRPEVLSQFKGVQGFDVPKCSFSYTAAG